MTSLLEGLFLIGKLSKILGRIIEDVEILHLRDPLLDLHETLLQPLLPFGLNRDIAFQGDQPRNGELGYVREQQNAIGTSRMDSSNEPIG